MKYFHTNLVLIIEPLQYLCLKFPVEPQVVSESNKTESTPEKPSEPSAAESEPKVTTEPAITTADDKETPPATPSSAPCVAPLTVDDTIKMDTSCVPKPEDDVSLIVHVDDTEKDFDYDLQSTPNKKAKTQSEGEEASSGDTPAEGDSRDMAEDASDKPESAGEGKKDEATSGSSAQKGGTTEGDTKATDDKKPDEKKKEDEKKDASKAKRLVSMYSFC